MIFVLYLQDLTPTAPSGCMAAKNKTLQAVVHSICQTPYLTLECLQPGVFFLFSLSIFLALHALQLSQNLLRSSDRFIHLASGIVDAILHQPFCHKSVKEEICKGKEIICFNMQIAGHIYITELSAPPQRLLFFLFQYRIS